MRSMRFIVGFLLRSELTVRDTDRKQRAQVVSLVQRKQSSMALEFGAVSIQQMMIPSVGYASSTLCWEEVL
jgi:hypothetical protein